MRDKTYLCVTKNAKSPEIETQSLSSTGRTNTSRQNAKRLEIASAAWRLLAEHI